VIVVSFDLKIKSVYSSLQLHLRCEYGEIPTRERSVRYRVHKFLVYDDDARTYTRTDSPKTKCLRLLIASRDIETVKRRNPMATILKWQCLNSSLIQMSSYPGGNTMYCTLDRVECGIVPI